MRGIVSKIWRYSKFDPFISTSSFIFDEKVRWLDTIAATPVIYWEPDPCRTAAGGKNKECRSRASCSRSFQSPVYGLSPIRCRHSCLASAFRPRPFCPKATAVRTTSKTAEDNFFFGFITTTLRAAYIHTGFLRAVRSDGLPLGLPTNLTANVACQCFPPLDLEPPFVPDQRNLENCIRVWP